MCRRLSATVRTLGVTAVLFGALHVAAAYDSLRLVYDDGPGLPMAYRLFLPPGHDDPGANYPLVVHLHGAGSGGDNNSSQLQYIDGLIEETQTDHPAFLLVPQSPTDGPWSSFGGDDPSPSAQMVVDLIGELESQYTIDTSRRYLTGLSMGAFGAWDLMGKLPGFFDAAAPLSGYGSSAQAEQYNQGRIWARHGVSDDIVPVSFARTSIHGIRQAGGDPLYTEVTGDHFIWDDTFNDEYGELYAWMFDGVDPSWVELLYDPETGSVEIDASGAYSGALSALNITFNLTGLLTPPELAYVDGVATPADGLVTVDASRIAFLEPTGEGFSGVLQLPGVLPTGLDFASLSELISRKTYRTHATGRETWYLSVRTGAVAIVPEPTTLALLACAACCKGRPRRVGKINTPPTNELR